MMQQSAFRITVIDSLTGLAELAKPWNELLCESRSNSIFLTWEWIQAWTECFLKPDQHLFVLLLHKEGELIGLAPWCVRRLRHAGCWLRQIEFLGTPEAGSDYLDVIARR